VFFGTVIVEECDIAEDMLNPANPGEMFLFAFFKQFYVQSIPFSVKLFGRVQNM